ncbi:PLD-like domain protein [Leptospira kemamanensis]|uniref:phospholipase D n=1 Tax=Leptospira kemamanensis TaxID=2484942 RepID=A0A4R9JKP5_9LEPT|nr:phospholipase D-like domain-containing protein [Leptospira kemamanensis]TGL46820.1 PLD-like domain protein [Leptospira kemamanensis]
MNLGRNIRWRHSLGFLFLWCFYSCHSSKEKLDLSALLFPNPPISDLHFSYPGRHVSSAKKRLVREVILSEIRKAKHSIRMYLYSIDDLEIITELYLQKRKGIEITIFGDKEESYPELESFGFPVKRWQGSGIHHTKLILFDKIRMFLGTGNFTSHGLETDNNVYWIQNITPSESENLVQTLEGNSPLGRVTLGELDYLISPEAGLEIQTEILEAIDSAKHSIRYLIYSHYDPVISFQLMKAHERGVKIESVYNGPMSTNPEGESLSQILSFPSQIWEDGNVDFVYKEDSYRGGLLHHKTMIIDERDVLVGSYNYSVSARDQNKEIFVKFSHPRITVEFLEEWKRIVSEALPLSSFLQNPNPIPKTDFKSFGIQSYRNSLFETNLFFTKSGSLDSNSNALSSQYRESLSLTSGLDPNTISEEREGNNRFIVHSNLPDPIWMESEVSNLTLQTQNLFYGTKVSVSSGEEIRSLEIWDGKHPKETISLDNQSVAVGRGDFRLGKEIWIWTELPNRTVSFCHTKEKDKLPKWMNFLKNRLFTKQKKVLHCSYD